MRGGQSPFSVWAMPVLTRFKKKGSDPGSGNGLLPPRTEPVTRETMDSGVGQAIAPSMDGEESPGSTGQGAR